MTIAWGGCTTCVERNLHWHSTRVDGGMCSCGAPQSGSDITGLVSPGLCGAGCAVQGGEEAGCEEGALRAERAATAEERAVCMACCSGAAPDPRAATSRDDGGKLLGSAAQPGAGCGVRFVEESGAGSRMRWRRERCGRRLRSSSVVQCGGGAVGSAPERGDGGEVCPVSFGNCLRLRRVSYSLLDPEATPRLTLLTLLYSTPCGGARRCAPAPSGGGRCASSGEC